MTSDSKSGTSDLWPESSDPKPGTFSVLILTQYFAPDGASWIPVAVSEEMRRRGHAVRVLTTYPHYTFGKVSHGYRQRLHFVEVLNEVQVRRVPIFARHSRNSVGRILSYLSFVISARFATEYLKDVDVVYVYGTPATVSEPARAWFRSLGIPFVYHVQDIWPESVTESGFLPRRLSTVVETLLNSWLRNVYSAASAVIAIAPTAKSLLVERGASEKSVHVVYNWADATESFARTGVSGLTLLYAGNLGHFQDLETVIRATSELAHIRDFSLLIAGSGVMEEELRRLVLDLGIASSVKFLGRIDPKEMGSVYASVDFQIIPLRNLDIFAGTIPSKFQAGLSYGVPVITTVKGDLTRLVENHQLGLVAQPENVKSLAAAFRVAYELSESERRAYANRAVRFFADNFSRDAAMDKIESILLTAAATKREGTKR